MPREEAERLSAEAKACPFCGQRLIPQDMHNEQWRIIHPGSDCLIADYADGLEFWIADDMATWNKRVEG